MNITLICQMCLLIRTIEGLLESQSIVDFKGKIEIEDVTNKVVSRIVITEQSNALIGNVFGMFSKKEPVVPFDKNEVKLQIFKRVSAEKVIFSSGTGNFARYLQIDKKIYFQHSKVPSIISVAEANNDQTLPSSSVLRKEIPLLKDNKIDEAQAWVY